MKSLLRAALVAAAVLGCSHAMAVQIFWTDWQGSDADPGPGFQANGVITTSTSTVNVTYTNSKGVGFYQSNGGGTDWWINRPSGTRNDAISPYTSSVVDNSPTGTDIIALQFAGSQTLTFSQPIANPVFAFVSLNGNGYAFLNQDFNILSVGGVDGNACGYWGCGGVTKVVVPLGNGDVLYELNSSGVGGSEPHGVIQFTGSFASLTWTSATNEYWNGFTVVVQGTSAEVFPAVPEPSTFALFGVSLVCLLLWRKRFAPR